MLATRHYCSLRDVPGSGYHHTARNGKPRSKWCVYCHGRLVVEQGMWGVFAWNGDTGHYSAPNAMRVFGNEPAARRYADTHAEDNAVVRWIAERDLSS